MNDTAYWRRLALAATHPLQIEILDLLDEGPASPNQLSQRLRQPLGNVSYHVSKLRERQLVELVDTKPRRGAVEHFYALVPVPAPTVGDAEEVALGRLEDGFYEAMAAGVNAEQIASRFAQLEVREAGEAVAA